jgi:hypothetical protein
MIFKFNSTGARRIKKLKKVAKAAYLEHREILDSMTCGIEVASYISANLSKHATTFNKAMDELETIDATTPKGVRL